MTTKKPAALDPHTPIAWVTDALATLVFSVLMTLLWWLLFIAFGWPDWVSAHHHSDLLVFIGVVIASVTWGRFRKEEGIRWEERYGKR